MAHRFQKASYTLETHIMMPGNAQAADTVQVVDAQVMAKRGELHTFEKSFNKVGTMRPLQTLNSTSVALLNI